MVWRITKIGRKKKNKNKQKTIKKKKKKERTKTCGPSAGKAIVRLAILLRGCVPTWERKRTQNDFTHTTDSAYEGYMQMSFASLL